jgi:hypothetical protein
MMYFWLLFGCAAVGDLVDSALMVDTVPKELDSGEPTDSEDTGTPDDSAVDDSAPDDSGTTDDTSDEWQVGEVRTWVVDCDPTLSPVEPLLLDIGLEINPNEWGPELQINAHFYERYIEEHTTALETSVGELRQNAIQGDWRRIEPVSFEGSVIELPCEFNHFRERINRKPYDRFVVHVRR